MQLEFRADTAAQSTLAASLQGRAGMGQAGQTKACNKRVVGRTPRCLCLWDAGPCVSPGRGRVQNNLPRSDGGEVEGERGAPETRAREVRVCNVLASLEHGSCPQSAPSWSRR